MSSHPAPLQPEGCRVVGEGASARIEIDWYDPAGYFLLGMSVVFTVPVGGWFYLGRSIGHPAWYAFGGVFALFVGLMFYGSLVRLKDVTTIYREDQLLRSTIGPLPFPGGTEVELPRVRAIRIRLKKGTAGGGRIPNAPGATGGSVGGTRRTSRGTRSSPSFDVVGLSESGEDLPLVQGLVSREQASWVAHTLGGLLELEDVSLEPGN